MKKILLHSLLILLSLTIIGCNDGTAKHDCTYCHGWEDIRYKHNSDLNATTN